MKLEYAIVLAVCAAGPLFLSARGAFQFGARKRALAAAIGLPFVPYLAWDMAATARGHWGFNPEAVTGIMVGNLPLEEVLFFLVIPFCAIFTWESVKWYTGRRR